MPENPGHLTYKAPHTHSAGQLVPLSLHFPQIGSWTQRPDDTGSAPLEVLGGGVVLLHQEAIVSLVL